MMAGRRRILSGREGHARVAVLSVIDEEFEALIDELGAEREVGTTGAFAPEQRGPADQPLPFVVAQCHSRSNLPASTATRRLVDQFRPETFLLVGIAGGIQRPTVRDNQITWSGPNVGDVVVAEYVHYAEYVKNMPSGHYLRYFPIDHPAQFLVGSHARTVMHSAATGGWHRGIRCDRPGSGIPEVHIGEIVALESIAGDPDSARQAEILRTFGNAMAVDMESMGVGRALHELRDHVFYNPLWMCVRGISDAVRSNEELKDLKAKYPKLKMPSRRHDNNDERALWKKYAAAVAARYAERLLYRLLSQPRPPVPSDPGAMAYARAA
jgi:nucleoside phosphorylase